MERKKHHFTELEYCFGQYFSKYCAPAITKDYRYYNHKQAEEFNKAYDSQSPFLGTGSVMQGMFRIQTANVHAAAAGKWSKKNLDDFICGVVNKIVSGKNFQKDWGGMIDRYRESLIAKLGTKGYIKAAEELGKSAGQKFIDPAGLYGQMRFIELVKEHLARTEMPQSSLEYILKEGMNSSLMMTLSNRIMRGRTLSPAEEEIYNIGNDLYKPSKTEKGAAFAMGAVMDAPALDGIGSLTAAPLKSAAKKASRYALEKGAVKMGAWLGERAAYKTAGNVSYLKGLATSAGIDIGANYWASTKISLDQSQKQYSKIVFGNEDTVGKYQKGALGFRKNGTEYISNINDGLGRKIKVAPMRLHVSDAVTAKDANQIMMTVSGNSSKLLKTVSAGMSKQAIHYNADTPIPVWMLHKTSKQCRTFSSSFFSIAKQMSSQGLRVWNVNGRNMTLAQVAQRASDYARAAVQIDKFTAEKQAERGRRHQTEPRQTGVKHEQDTAYTAGLFPSQSVSPTVASLAQPTVQAPPMADVSPYSNMPQMSGWGKYLENAGMNGFSDVSKNLGYVFAMLPDMLIGMFTGKTTSFTIGNNILPLAAITAGMFSKNPLLKLMLMGFGGANILNNAGHEALGLSESKNVVPKFYKQYADEPLNPRINNVFMKGRSLIADIDNKPVIINISDDAVDAYEKKAVPLNTLANAVLRKYDETRAVASSSYDRNMAALESQDQRRAYGLK